MKLQAPHRPLVVGIFGVLLAGLVTADYAHSGFGGLHLWLLGGAVLGVALSLRSTGQTRSITAPQPHDLLATACLLLIILPLYFYHIYTVPWQINTDEIAIMQAARAMAESPTTDVFGLSGYFGFPAGVFVVFGRLGALIGGVDLYHMRVVHAAFGVGCVLLAYALFRAFLSPLRAFTLALILGANHALFAISRMAMRDNSGLFLELLCLALLVRGVQRRSHTLTFIGGAAAGLTFYSYYPGRITIVIAVTVLVAMWVLGVWSGRSRAQDRPGSYMRHFGPLMLGFGMIAAPVIVASAKHPERALQFQREQLLIYPEGRKLQQDWMHDSTTSEAWTNNIKRGLAAFNGSTQDMAWIYSNPGHGFVDPATGILLWIGVIVAAVRLARAREPLLPEVLALTGFLALYLAFAFVINKSPNYTRMLVILPFVSFLAGSAIWWMADAVATRSRRLWLASALSVVGCLVIVGWNVLIFRDLVVRGERAGDPIGSTGRLVAARKAEAGHTWIIAGDAKSPYFGWGGEGHWKSWLGFFVGRDQPLRVVAPDSLATLKVDGPSTVFMPVTVWVIHQDEFRRSHTVDSVMKVTPNGMLVAAELGRHN